VKQLKCDWSVG